MSPGKVSGGQGGFLAGYAYLFLTQAVSRLLPFIVNAMVARRLTPEEFGVPTVHFQLLSAVILTSREGFRRALMRDTKATKDNCQEAASWLVVPLGALLSAAVPTTVFFANGLTKTDPYAQAVALYGIAAFLELLAEPFYIRAQRRSKFKLRLVTETIATLARSFVTFVFVTKPETGVTVPLAFAFGQLAYGTCIWLMFAAAQWEFVGEGIDLIRGRSSISWGTLTLLGTFTLQAVWKLLLSEGEKGVLMLAGSADAQGTYALVSALGALFVRIVLQPFEEAAFLMFAGENTNKDAKKKTANEDERRKFNSLMKIAVVLGLLSALHGPQYCHLALNLLYGERWANATGAAATLGGFAVMILFLAVNGITEAYAHAVMSPKELASANMVLLITSVFNVAVSVVLQEYMGALGLVVANCFAMSIRIAYTLCYIRFVRFSWTSEAAFLPALMPRKQLLLLMCGTCALTLVTSKIHSAIHVLAGAFTLLITLAALLKFERSSLMTIGRSSKKEE